MGKGKAQRKRQERRNIISDLKSKCKTKEKFIVAEIKKIIASNKDFAVGNSHSDSLSTVTVKKEVQIKSEPDDPSTSTGNFTTTESNDVSHLAEMMYEMTPVKKETQSKKILANSFPVKICGFACQYEEMFGILLTFLQAKVVPENRRFLIYYAAEGNVLDELVSAINSLDPTKTICKLVREFTWQNDVVVHADDRAVDEFGRQEFLGLLLPTNRKIHHDLNRIAIESLSYIFNLPMNATINGLYWHKVRASQYVKISPGLTIVDFTTPDEKLEAKESFERQGFVLIGENERKFWNERELLQQGIKTEISST